MITLKFDIKKDRKWIAKLIESYLPAMVKNKRMCQEVADAILVYIIDKEQKFNGGKNG